MSLYHGTEKQSCHQVLPSGPQSHLVSYGTISIGDFLQSAQNISGINVSSEEYGRLQALMKAKKQIHVVYRT